MSIQLDENTKMVGRTKDGDPVWERPKAGLFIIDNGTVVRPLRWWQKDKWTYRKLPKPHLSYGQVALANEKGKIILKALRNGPIYEKEGFLYGRDNRLLMTKAVGKTVLHWMTGCGIVLTREEVSRKRFRIDIDAEATRKNNVI